MESGVCQRIIVSTEDVEIAAVAQACGAEVPFLRPAELARDDVPAQAAIDHLVAWLAEREDYTPDAVLVLQPTSPLRSVGDIRGALQLLEDRNADCVVAVAPCTTPPHLLRQLDQSGRFLPWRASAAPETPLQRMALYQINGAIYLDRLPARSDGPPLAFIMPPERSLDIDTSWDLQLAAAILSLAPS